MSKVRPAREDETREVRELRDRFALNAGHAYEALHAAEKNLEELRRLGDERLGQFAERFFALRAGLHSMRNELSFNVFKFIE